MDNIKEKIISKTTLTICAGLALLFSLFPYASLKGEALGETVSTDKYSLLSLISDAPLLAILVLLFSIALIVVNYVLNADYKKYILIGLPGVSVLLNIILISSLKSSNLDLGFASAAFKPSIGFFLELLVDIAAVIIAILLMTAESSDGAANIFTADGKIDIKNVGSAIVKGGSDAIKSGTEAIKNIGANTASAMSEAKTAASVTAERIIKEKGIDPEVLKRKSEIKRIEEKLQPIYAALGQKYADYVSNNVTGSFEASDFLTEINEKIEEKARLENEILEIEKNNMNNKLVQKKQKAEEKFNKEKENLDKALALEVINQDEYDKKLSSLKKGLDNFDEIERIETQFELGIITEEEKAAKIKEITE
ncbi:MAG: hypothetical protein J5562_08575 [Clostridia bacterium]|nr:hypothetical protein [Clostridia bacterium]